MLESGSAAAAFVDLARTKFGVKRFVLQSSTAIEEGGPAMGKVHTLLKERGDRGEIGWAVLRPSWFQGELHMFSPLSFYLPALP